MNTQNKIYVGLGALVVLSGLAYMQSRRSKTFDATHSMAAASAALPEIKLGAADVEKVTKVTLRNGDKPEIVLEKTGDQWMLTSPVKAAANQQNVKSMLDNLKELKVKDSINDRADAPAMYKDYQLQDDKAMHVVAFKDSDKLFDAYFGKNGSRGQMARLSSKPGIWVVAGYSQYQYAREPKDWRNKEIFKFEDANVVSIGISNINGDFSFSKNDDKWSATFKGKAIDRFDPEKIKDLIRVYKSLNAEDFGDGKSDADTGLGKPPATLQIVLKDNAGTYKLLFGNTTTGTSRYARKADDPTPFVVGSWAADWAVAKADKFQKPEDKDGGAPDAAKPKK